MVSLRECVYFDSSAAPTVAAQSECGGGWQERGCDLMKGRTRVDKWPQEPVCPSW